MQSGYSPDTSTASSSRQPFMAIQLKIYWALVSLFAILSGISLFGGHTQLSLITILLLVNTGINTAYTKGGGSRSWPAILLGLLAYIAVIFLTWKYSITGLIWAYPLIGCMLFLCPLRPAIYLNASFITSLTLICNEILGSSIALLVLTSQLVTLWLVLLLHVSITRLVAQLERETTTDNLTRCGNRSALRQAIEAAANLCKRYQTPSSLVYINLDNFREVNHKQGSAVGDIILKEVANVLKSRLRMTDSLFHFSGEEFVGLLPNTRLEDAMSLTQDLSKSLESYEFHGNTHLSLCAGLAEFEADESAHEWLDRCHHHLMQAKQLGPKQIAPQI